MSEKDNNCRITVVSLLLMLLYARGKWKPARGFMSLKFWSVAASNGVSYVQQPFPIPHDGG